MRVMNIIQDEQQKNSGITIRRDTGGQEYGFLIRLVMQLSGGRIDTVQKAYYVLATAVIILSVLAAYIFFF